MPALCNEEDTNMPSIVVTSSDSPVKPQLSNVNLDSMDRVERKNFLIAHASRTFKLVRQMAIKLFQHEALSNSLNAEDQASIGIECRHVDWPTEQLRDRLDFIEPLNHAEVDKTIDITKPWYYDIHDKGLLSEKVLETDRGALLNEGRRIVYLIRSCLVHSFENGPHRFKQEFSPALPERLSRWRTRSMKKGEMLYARNDRVEWAVEEIIDRCAEDYFSSDFNTPHISCILHSNVPLRDTELLACEIWCILLLTNGRIQTRPYHRHRIFPVTVFSASGKQGRFVQGYVDSDTGRLHVRQSSIKDFTTDVPLTIGPQLRYNLVDTVRWLLGKPIGSTGFTDLP